MKAKEYYEKYKGKIDSNDETIWKKAVAEIIKEFVDELFFLIKQRHIDIKNAKSLSATIATFIELNQKWNALCKFFPILRKDGFREFIIEAHPDIGFMWETCEFYKHNMRCVLNFPLTSQTKS